MDLKDRKYIAQNKDIPERLLPKYVGGLNPNEDPLKYAWHIPVKQETLESKIQLPKLDIKNPQNPIQKDAPSFADKYGGAISGGVSGALGMAQDYYSYGYDNTVKDLNNIAGNSEADVYGIKTQLQNTINAEQENERGEEEIQQKRLGSITKGAGLGATVGTAFGPLGTVIGGLAGGAIGGVIGWVGGKKARDERERIIREQQIKAAVANDYAINTSKSAGMNQEYLSKHGNSEDQLLYAANGKQPDGKISNGEVYGHINPVGIIDYIDRVPGKKNNKDSHYISGTKDPGTFVITNKKDPVTGASLSDLATVDPYAALSIQGALKQSGILNKSKGEYKCGKLPKYEDGYLNWIPNVITSGLGGLIGLNQYIGAKKQNVYSPNTFAPNPYGNLALNELAGLRINPYPIMSSLRNAEARNMYALNNSGGLSGAQKYLGRIASVRNTQDSIANALMKIQEQNNTYRSQYANLAYQYGAQDAANRMAARRADDEVYMRSHAARQQGMQLGLQNMFAALQQGVANDETRRMFNKIYSQYAA